MKRHFLAATAFTSIAPTQFRKLFLRSTALLSVSLPLLTLVPSPTAQADPASAQCTEALGINICASLQPTGYELYAQSGTVTSPKTLLPAEGGCPVWAIDTPQGHFRIEGCAGSSIPFPSSLQGAVKRVGSTQQAFTLNLPRGYFVGDDSHLGEKGYFFYLDGQFIASAANWSRQDAVTHLELAKKTYPNRKVEGYFDGQKVGYELFWDGVRVGFEPSWTEQQAIDNLQWNKQTYPNTRVEGALNGTKVGYELFWNGVRVGFEPSWTEQQAIDNLRWNQQTYPNTKVMGLFNGEAINL